jgi:hypothetical protein
VASAASITESEPSELREAVDSNAMQANSVNIQLLQPQIELTHESTVNQVGEQVNEIMFVDENVDELVRQNTLTILKEKFDDPSKQAKERGNVLDENPDEIVVNQTTDYVPSTTSSKCLGPNQPILSEYATKLLGSDPYPRRFNPQLYKKYPWITYEIENEQCVCFSCREFENDDSFVFN